MRFSVGTLSAMPKSAKKISVFFIYFALAAGTIAVFWHVRNFDFVNYDDNLYVSENPHVFNGLTADSVIWAFTTPHAGNWLPLTWISFMLDYQLFGRNPGGMHLINLLFHLANALLLFAILKKITAAVWPSAFVAAAFALHPMHVESVAWITERKDVLSTLFLLLTLAAYISYVRSKSLFRYILAVVLFGLGILAKPMIVTLPFILLLLDYWPLNRFESQAVKTSGCKSAPAPNKRSIINRLIIEKIPFFVLSAVSSVITFFVQRGSGAVPDINALPLNGRFANAFLSYGKYIGKLFWPQNMTVIYPLNAGGIQFWLVVFCVLLLLGISLFVLYFGRKQKYLMVGWFWFLGTLIPVIGIIQSGAQALADRYTYIPYIGLFIMIAWGLPQLISKWPYRKITLGIAMAISLTALGISAHRQVSYWNNSVTLFSHAVDVTQNNYIAHDHLAHYWRKQGDFALAVEHYTKAIRIAPDYLDTLFGLGCTFADHGDLNQAIQYFQKLLQLGPHSGYAAHSHINLGAVLRKQGKYKEACEQFTAALQLSPDFAEAHYEFAIVFFLQGKLDEAIDQLRTAIRLKPDWPAPMNDLAWFIATHPEIKNRSVNEAISLASRACELTNYKTPIFMGTLAAAYASAGRFAEAIEMVQKAMSLIDKNDKYLLEQFQRHLDLYKVSKPYIETW